MEKLTYTRPQTYIVSCMNTCALLEGSNEPTVTGKLPDGTKIEYGTEDHYDTSSGDAKKHDAWDSWD